MSENEPTPAEASRGARLFGAAASMKATREAGIEPPPMPTPA